MNRNLLIMTVIAALIAFYSFIIDPLSDKRASIQDDLFLQYKSLMKHEQFLRNAQSAEEELENSRTELEKQEEFIIRENDTSLAFARLQTKVQDMAASAGLEITSLKPLQGTDQKVGYKKLPLYMDCKGNMSQLSKFLNHLDSTWEFIAIDSLQVSVMLQGKLRIRIQLSGLMKS